MSVCASMRKEKKKKHLLRTTDTGLLKEKYTTATELMFIQEQNSKLMPPVSEVLGMDRPPLNFLHNFADLLAKRHEGAWTWMHYFI